MKPYCITQNVRSIVQIIVMVIGITGKMANMCPIAPSVFPAVSIKLI